MPSLGDAIENVQEDKDVAARNIKTRLIKYQGIFGRWDFYRYSIGTPLNDAV
jgi:hypothetical protein